MEEGLDCVAVQETRMQTEGRFMTPHFEVFASTATQRGSHGLQLWIVPCIAKYVIAAAAVSPR
jgi:hypothetical protein